MFVKAIIMPCYSLNMVYSQNIAIFIIRIYYFGIIIINIHVIMLLLLVP